MSDKPTVIYITGGPGTPRQQREVAATISYEMRRAMPPRTLRTRLRAAWRAFR